MQNLIRRRSAASDLFLHYLSIKRTLVLSRLNVRTKLSSEVLGFFFLFCSELYSAHISNMPM